MIKPLKKAQRFNGDAKLKQILPTYQPPKTKAIDTIRRPHGKFEEIIPAVREREMRREVREDLERPRRSRFRKPEVPKKVREVKEPMSRMTSIKVLVVAIGILILVSSIAYAYYDRTSGEKAEELKFEDKSYEFYDELIGCEVLCYGQKPAKGVFSAQKVQLVTSEDIEMALEPEYNFYIEIKDVSDYPVNFSRSLELGNAISNVNEDEIPELVTSSGDSPDNYYHKGNSDVFLINSDVNLKVNDDEVHAAKLVLLVWK